MLSAHPSLVLAFHRISKRKLVELVQALLRGRHACTLSGRCNRPSPGLILTFDDGVEEAVECGAEVAGEQGWPVTFYLPTAFLDGAVMWQEELTVLVRHARPGRYELFGEVVDLPEAGARNRLKRTIVKELKRHRPSDLERVMQRLRESLDPERSAPVAAETPRAVSWSRVAELARRPEITFGSHTVTHKPMTAMTEQEIRDEALRSKRRIEEHSGSEVEHFCYPFGFRFEIGALAPQVVGDYYATAVTLEPGTLGRGTERTWIPRVDLYEKDHPVRAALKVWRARWADWTGKSRLPAGEVVEAP